MHQNQRGRTGKKKLPGDPKGAPPLRTEWAARPLKRAQKKRKGHFPTAPRESAPRRGGKSVLQSSKNGRREKQNAGVRREKTSHGKAVRAPAGGGPRKRPPNGGEKKKRQLPSAQQREKGFTHALGKMSAEHNDPHMKELTFRKKKGSASEQTYEKEKATHRVQAKGASPS